MVTYCMEEKLQYTMISYFFRGTDVVFTLKGDILSMISDYDFDRTDSHDAKQIINFLDEMHFDIHAKGKSSRDENLIKNYLNKRAY